MNFTQVIADVTSGFNQNLQDLVQGVREGDLTPESFQALIGGLKGAVNHAGLKALVGIVSEFEERGDRVEHGDQLHRFKQDSEKEWLTAFGIARIPRRYYQPDAGGKGWCRSMFAAAWSIGLPRRTWKSSSRWRPRTSCHGK